MKDLPKVFANKISDDIKNTQDIFYGNDRTIKNIKKEYNEMEIIRKINNIFSSKSHVYKSKVKITLVDREVEKVIVGKTNKYLITFEGEYIKISAILDIEKI